MTVGHDYASPAPQPSIRTRGGTSWLERGFDIVSASVLLIFFSPLFLLILVLLRLQGPGPVLVREKRIGRDGAPFDALRFGVTKPGAAAARSVPLREFLSQSGLAELPRLMNVLCGQMSLVGPEALSEPQARRLGPYLADYCAGRPGLTGLGRIYARGDRDLKLALDLFYVHSKKLGLYAAILLASIPAAFLRRETAPQ